MRDSQLHAVRGFYRLELRFIDELAAREQTIGQPGRVEAAALLRRVICRSAGCDETLLPLDVQPLSLVAV
jgi:hypothetical protein